MSFSSTTNCNYMKIFQVSTALVSFLASSSIAVSSASSENGGLSTPYRRIIFGLSIFDLLQSCALFTGPLSVPLPEGDTWVREDEALCKTNGFLLTIGTTGTMMYSSFLCLYYLCKLKLRMSDEAIRQKVEMRFHIAIAIFSIGLSSAALGLDALHVNNLYYSFCSFAPVPVECPDKAGGGIGSCDPTIEERVDIFVLIGYVVLPIICLTGIIFTMGSLCRDAIQVDRVVERGSSLRSFRPRVQEEQEHNEEEQSENSETPQEQVQRLSRLYRREIMIQTICHIGTFSLTYIPMIVGNLSISTNTDVVGLRLFTAIGIFFFPLGGFLNILVYTRPKVASIRRNHPECSRLRGLWFVIKAGGEIPDNIDLSSSSNQCCCSFQWVGLEDEDSDSIPRIIYIDRHPNERSCPTHGSRREAQRESEEHRM